MIKFENVEIKYVNDFYCLYNFNTTINKHTLFVGDEFVGSHAILRLIAKIDKHYTGNIFIAETNLKDIKDKDLNISYVPNKPELFFTKSLFKNLSYPLKIRKFNKFDIKNIVNDAILKYNLGNFSKKVKNMTLSEKKIISLVRAVLRKPKYVLLEDFFENLEESYIRLASKIIDDAKEFSTIIACEKENLNLQAFADFEIVNLNK